MDDIAYSQAIARLKRAMPNHPDVNAVLDEAQRRLSAKPAQAPQEVAETDCPVCAKRRATTLARTHKARAKQRAAQAAQLQSWGVPPTKRKTLAARIKRENEMRQNFGPGNI